MNVAVVENNVITNVIVAGAPDGVKTYPIPEGKWIGDIYEDQPASTIESRVAALEEEAEQAKIDRAALTYLLTGEETV